ncbi:MAG TPA: trehalose-phosphatase [Ramlibacter sp.]|jgi:trehalose 6-phosphate phosphatase|uniref:trehalose-phosphatase n=1 Tax=Ramlibacter sp. TaxID=1917967 RepID=UPI002D6A4274|nr:trehalose-phosphatase [Ramlibacter sp.]HZY17065.1 trehalose-phosphatase [Ramlibacter sp.]
MNFVDILSPACALFLDFDGTLVDIAPEPGAVVVPSGLVPTLAALQAYLGGAVAVVSGRPIREIDQFLGPLRLPAAGVHGAERRSAGGQIERIAGQPLHAVELAVQALAARHPVLIVEHKQASIALHYRKAPELEAACLDAMHKAVAQSPGLTLLRGKMVVEAKPGSASKGQAIEAFLREAPFAGRTPVFVGDDITDEIGFSTVQRLGGLGVKVGEGPTVAWQRLADPGALRQEFQTAVARKVPARAPA